MIQDSRGEDTVRIAIVDDHEMMLDGLQTGLKACPGIEVVGTAATVAACIEVVERTRPDVVVADYQLPDGTGVDVARRVAGTAPTIIITGLERSGLLHDVVEAGCRGLVLKTVTIAELAESIRAVASGANAFSTDDLLALASRSPTDVGATLTGREREVLRLLGQAQSAESIAASLGLSINTVRKHIAAVLMKLRAKSQLEAVITAQRAGLI